MPLYDHNGRKIVSDTQGRINEIIGQMARSTERQWAKQFMDGVLAPMPAAFRDTRLFDGDGRRVSSQPPRMVTMEMR